MVSFSANTGEPRYLLRFDDICPTMNWVVWDTIETYLTQYHIRPILAIVPDNQDPKLIVEPPRTDFWERARQWQSKSYTIALHGYQHLYVNNNAGLIRLTCQSEFAGLSHEEQKTKLKQGLDIFTEQGVRVDAWVAPSHSFDQTTVNVLAELGVAIIIDGLHRHLFTDALGVTWIPQQLWNFAPKPTGVWTVCNHHNHWTDRQLIEFRDNLERYAPKMTNVASILNDYVIRPPTLIDKWDAFLERMWNHSLKPSRAFIHKLINY